MNNQKTMLKALKIINFWESEVEKYDFEQLLKKPNSESWSMGQVYIHLINATLQFHLKQIKICLQSDENQSKNKNFKGFLAYNVLRKFPPIKIKVPSSESYTPKQPKNKEQILTDLQSVKQAMENILPLIENSSNKGKTKHPGFSFLNANEWFRLIEMHFNHHLRQKSRIDKYLNNGE